MAKKQRSSDKKTVDKARESRKRMVEGWKEFWNWVGNLAWGSAKSIFYTLKATTESWTSKVYNSKSKNPDFSEEAREKYKNKSDQYSNKSKESISNAWESAKQAWKWARWMLRWWGKAVGNAVITWYQEVKIADEKTWQAIQKRHKEKWKNNISKTRRFIENHVISWSLALALLWTGGTVAVQHNMDKFDGWNIEIQNNGRWNSNELLLIPTQWYNILNNKTITTNAPLTRRYLWWDLQNTWELNIKDTLVVNPAESLHNLWDKKIKKYGMSGNKISQLDTMDVKAMSPEDVEKFRVKYPIDAAYLFVVRPYIDGEENKETMSLQEFINKTNKVVENTRELTQDYDWELTWNKKELFDTIRGDITWECIAAYAMTELCENKENWEFNKELFDLMLRNYWANFLAKIPAIYDWKTSYWLYQFTEHALHDTPWDVRWASIVNKVIPEKDRIPWSVIDLISWQEQTMAAYMFAIQNLSTAVKKLTDQQAKDLLSYRRSNKEKFRDNMTQLIAMCHHRPADSITLKKWHEDKYKNDIYTYGNASHGKPYWKASKKNYESLKK